MKYGGMLHVSFVKRKPKPNGAEIKTAADVQSMVMMRLEVQKGKVHVAQHPPEYTFMYPPHVAIGLRLLKPWLHTERVVNGDAAFSSFASAVAYLEHGLRFRGVVK